MNRAATIDEAVQALATSPLWESPVISDAVSLLQRQRAGRRLVPLRQVIRSLGSVDDPGAQAATKALQRLLVPPPPRPRAAQLSLTAPRGQLCLAPVAAAAAPPRPAAPPPGPAPPRPAAPPPGPALPRHPAPELHQLALPQVPIPAVLVVEAVPAAHRRLPRICLSPESAEMLAAELLQRGRRDEGEEALLEALLEEVQAHQDAAEDAEDDGPSRTRFIRFPKDIRVPLGARFEIGGLRLEARGTHFVARGPYLLIGDSPGLESGKGIRR